MAKGVFKIYNGKFLGEILSDYRYFNKIKVRDMAKKLRIPSSTYHNIERGKLGSKSVEKLWYSLFRNNKER